MESRFEVDLRPAGEPAAERDARGAGGGYGRLVEMIGRSHGNDYVRARHRRTAAQRFRTLRGAGLARASAGSRATAAPTCGPPPGLQRDFSLFQTLSLYLLDTLPRIPPERETYALDVLSMVESILEDPDVILWKQLDRARGQAVAEMKAKGMEYDERMAELEKVEYPKPNRDFVYATFNEFAAKHPWVGAGEHPAEVDRARDGRAVHDLRRLRARVRAAALRGAACSATSRRPTRRWCRRSRRPTGTTRSST